MPQTDITIIKALLQAGPEYVSGNDLARKLGISRVGVWARLDKLRDQDFGLDAVRHRGYRLLHEPNTLNHILIRSYLDLLNTNSDVLFFDSVDSTNSEAERALAEGTETPFTVVARSQLKGRGRMGREWHSPDEGNLYASFAFRPRLPLERMQTVTIWMGLQICDLINQLYSIPLKIKWPNDLILEGRKAGGILTEARVDSDLTRDLVIGLGLNINGRTNAWPESCSGVAISLSSASKEPLVINRLTAQIIQHVYGAYETFMEGGFDSALSELWQKYDFLKGKQVSARHGQKVIAGTADGINQQGALCLKTDSGETLFLNSGEVSLGSTGLLKQTAQADGN